MLWTWEIGPDDDRGPLAFASAAAAGGGYAPEALRDAVILGIPGYGDGRDHGYGSDPLGLQRAERQALARHTRELRDAVARAEAYARAEAESEGCEADNNELRDAGVAALERCGPPPAWFLRHAGPTGHAVAVAYGTGSSRAIAWLAWAADSDGDWTPRVARVGVESSGEGTGLYAARTRAVEDVLGRPADVEDAWGITPWTSPAAHAELLCELRARLERATATLPLPQWREVDPAIMAGGPAALEID